LRACGGVAAEPGYNAIEYEAAVNSWVRRVRILNADSGIKIYSSIFNTVSDVEIGVTPRPRRGGRCGCVRRLLLWL
jgi:hypothetical protein